MADKAGCWNVAVVGAGPAGLFAARELAAKGVNVFLFNRDIKPGGLAEYGIYPDKLRIKDGLRAQFRLILSDEHIHYFGNVTIGNDKPLSLKELYNWGFSAVLVTCGAQGTKWLGLPGESLQGVYHAKDLVYHYNHLPPFSQRQFKIGKKVAIVGVGNVMADIARYLIHHLKVDEVITVARRGPAEVKFERKEFEPIAANLDLDDFCQEISRVSPIMQSLGQDPDAAIQLIRNALEKAAAPDSNTRMIMRFLYSPIRILGDEQGRVCGLEVEENTLIRQNDQIKAKGLGKTTILPVDTVIFAIGDRVDESIGLPVNGNEFVKLESPKYPVSDCSYEVMDPQTQKPITGVFVGGWARNASSGVVGITRRDGVNASAAVMQYLKTQPTRPPMSAESINIKLKQLGYQPVDVQMLERINEIEKSQAENLGREEFKFDSNEEMLELLNRS